MPRPTPKCSACSNAGFLHMLRMGGHEEVVIPCPECIEGKRYESFLRKLNAKESGEESEEPS